MEKYYTIGQVSKIIGISIDRLRNYDKIDLIKPYYTDENTGYRYYIGEQFRTLRFINYLRKIGVPLKEIKKIFNNKINSEEFVNFLDSKIIEIEDEIENLQLLKSDILEKKERIENSIKRSSITNIYIKEIEERYVISKEMQNDIDFILQYKEDIFENFRSDKFPDKNEYVIEKGLYIKDYNENESEKINIYLITNKKSGIENAIIPKGKYLCLSYKDGKRNEAIKELKEYIKINNIKTKGIFLNVILKTMPREEFQIQVLI